MHTIMLIDDDQTQLIMYQKALDSGYRSMAMERGKNALEYLRKANKLPSLIVMDIDMPVMNGFEVFSALMSNKDTKNIPVIFISGNDDSSTEMEAYALGAVDYMVKPVSAEILRRKVDLQISMLDRRKRLHSENAELLDYNEQLQDYNNELQAMANESVKNVLYMQYFLTGVVTELLAKKDGFAAVHSKRVARFMDMLLKQMIAMVAKLDVLFYIIKKNQTLLSVLPKDFSFIAEDNLQTIFATLSQLNIRVNMMQNSALSFSLCIDDNEMLLSQLRQRLSPQFRLRYNLGLQLITIRYYTQDIIDRIVGNSTILLQQRSRNTAQLIIQ